MQLGWLWRSRRSASESTSSLVTTWCLPSLEVNTRVNLLNFRGNQSENASAMRKTGRVLTYYMRLIRYAAVSEAAVFHVLWNNRFEGFDRTILTLYIINYAVNGWFLLRTT
jgi:hypothetical protein